MMSAPSPVWGGIKGLGTAKLAQLLAALELGRRAALPATREKTTIKSTQQAAEYFKTRLRGLADEHFRIVYMLRDLDNVSHYDAWIKSTATRFYEIDFAWKKGEHPKRGKFSPDFFIKVGDLILVIEIKGDEELREPSEENRKKNEYAQAHFEWVDEYLKGEDSPIRYKFNFLTPFNFNTFFQELRDGRIADYRSDLDVKLEEET